MTVEFVEPATAISSPFDIMWRVLERGDSLQLRVEYRHGQFSAERVEAWLDRYLELLLPGSSKRSSVTVQV